MPALVSCGRVHAPTVHRASPGQRGGGRPGLRRVDGTSNPTGSGSRSRRSGIARIRVTVRLGTPSSAPIASRPRRSRNWAAESNPPRCRRPSMEGSVSEPEAAPAVDRAAPAGDQT